MICKEPSHVQSRRFYGALCDLKKRSEFEKQLQVAQKYLKGNLENVIDDLDDMHPALLSCGLLGPVRLDKVHETIHTSLIAWFLNPDEYHGFNETIVSALLKYADNFFRSGKIKVEKVQPEALFGNDKDQQQRIDIKVEGTVDERPWVLYLEAKLWSDEGKDQLSSYNRLIEKQQDRDKCNIFRVYLTPYGGLPDTGGANKWKPMSYSEMTTVFWDAAEKQKEKQEEVHGYHVLRHYLASLLKDVLGIPLPLEKSEYIPYSALMLSSKPKK